MGDSSASKKNVLFVVAILLVAAVLRTMPHVSNVTPFFAISILVGFILGRKRSVLSALLSVSAMFLGDLFIGAHETMGFVYAGIALAAGSGALASSAIQKQKTATRRAAGAFVVSGVASTIFFIVSNFGVWLVGGLYPMTLGGLVTCFTMAIPFFTNSLTSDLFFGTALIMIASFEMSRRSVDRRQFASAATEQKA